MDGLVTELVRAYGDLVTLLTRQMTTLVVVCFASFLSYYALKYALTRFLSEPRSTTLAFASLFVGSRIAGLEAWWLAMITIGLATYAHVYMREQSEMRVTMRVDPQHTDRVRDISLTWAKLCPHLTGEPYYEYTSAIQRGGVNVSVVLPISDYEAAVRWHSDNPLAEILVADGGLLS